jgi:hypothetical protein
MPLYAIGICQASAISGQPGLNQRYFFQDPLVSIIWWLQVSMLMLGAAKQLGK